jgi:hypothetical protein
MSAFGTKAVIATATVNSIPSASTESKAASIFEVVGIGIGACHGRVGWQSQELLLLLNEADCTTLAALFSSLTNEPGPRRKSGAPWRLRS